MNGEPNRLLVVQIGASASQAKVLRGMRFRKVCVKT